MQFTNNIKTLNITNRISNNDHHECPFYDALNNWWYQNENVMKHVIAFTNGSDEVVNSLKLQVKSNMIV
jgi:hypothetical protein